jgi:hypothetical protein
MICANCEQSFDEHKATGVSSLYNPEGPDILLCERCFLEEDALIDRRGNNLLERLKHYLHVLKKARQGYYSA